MFRKSEKRVIKRDKENLLINFPSNSRYSESYRTMRTNLFFSDMENEIKSIVITSSVEKEGKTTTALNLAYTIAQTDRKVLLMDCDLRRPHLTSLMTGKHELGVTELVAEVFGFRLTKGSLESFSVNDLILLTKLQKRSGSLELENDETQVAIYFDKGKMTDIYWKNRPESKKLAATLIRDKLLTEKEAYLALGHQKKSVQRLGTILYTMGFVTKKNLAKALSVHTIEAVRAVSTMLTGHFVFTSAKNDNKPFISQNLDFEKLYSEFSSGDESLKYFNSAIDKAICGTEVDNLFALPSGSIPPNPSELVGSKRMAFLIENLKNRFDFIIIDTPPVMPASDALLVAPNTDGTVFIIKSGNTERKIIQDVVEQYRSANLTILGTVLNQVDMKKEGYYRYYHKYYSSYYGK